MVSLRTEDLVNSMTSTRSHWLFLLVVIVLCGCGRQNAGATVTGTVTMDGHPAANLLVIFHPDGERPSEGVTDAAGYYELQYSQSKKGATPGHHTVSILPAPPDDNTPPGTKIIQIPSRYNSKTELTAQVNAGKNHLNFTLTSDPANNP